MIIHKYNTLGIVGPWHEQLIITNGFHDLFVKVQIRPIVAQRGRTTTDAMRLQQTESLVVTNVRIAYSGASSGNTNNDVILRVEGSL